MKRALLLAFGAAAALACSPGIEAKYCLRGGTSVCYTLEPGGKGKVDAGPLSTDITWTLEKDEIVIKNPSVNIDLRLQVGEDRKELRTIGGAMEMVFERQPAS